MTYRYCPLNKAVEITGYTGRKYQKNWKPELGRRPFFGIKLSDLRAVVQKHEGARKSYNRRQHCIFVHKSFSGCMGRKTPTYRPFVRRWSRLRRSSSRLPEGNSVAPSGTT